MSTSESNEVSLGEPIESSLNDGANVDPTSSLKAVKDVQQDPHVNGENEVDGGGDRVDTTEQESQPEDNQHQDAGELNGNEGAGDSNLSVPQSAGDSVDGIVEEPEEEMEVDDDTDPPAAAAEDTGDQEEDMQTEDASKDAETVEEHEEAQEGMTQSEETEASKDDEDPSKQADDEGIDELDNSVPQSVDADKSESQDGEKTDPNEATEDKDKTETADAGKESNKSDESEKDDDEQPTNDGNVGARQELKNYAAGVADELLGMMGLDKLDEVDKEQMTVADSLMDKNGEETSAGDTETAAANSTADTASKEKPAEGKAAATTAATTAANTSTKTATASAEASKKELPKPSPKAQQQCIVCKKLGKCKYNIVRNGDIKHLCDDNCFKIFRTTPTAYLKPQESKTAAAPATPTAPATRQTRASTKTATTPGKADDDVEIVGTSRIAPRGRPAVNTKCSVCNKISSVKHEVKFEGKQHKLCSDPCFAAFRYANKLSMSSCDNCGVFCYNESNSQQTIQYEGQQRRFCSMTCVKTFKTKKQRIVPCAWCGTKKSNFDMVERINANNKYQLFCTLNCLSLYRVNLQATSNQNVPCDQCHKMAPAQYHLTMSDASVRNFCAYNCVMQFQGQFQTGTSSKTPPTGKAPAAGKTPITIAPSTTPTTPGRTPPGTRQSARVAARQTQASVPVITSVRSLAQPTSTLPLVSVASVTAQSKVVSTSQQQTPVRPIVAAVPRQTVTTQQIIVQPPPPKQVKNKALLCKPFLQTKATSCRPHTLTKESQTDGEAETKPVLIPVPIPIYVPVPMAMYTTPTPYPVPMPIPVPVPIFIPTTKKSSSSIFKKIKEIQERIPADPFEAEMLMMAEAVATGGKQSDESSSSEDEAEPAAAKSPVAGESGEFGEDMLQMALRMASEISQEPVLDGDKNAVNNQSDGGESGTEDGVRTRRGKRRKRSSGGRSKRPRVEETPVEEDTTPAQPVVPPDANMVLKFTYGVNAYKNWVVQKNSELEQLQPAPGSRRRRPFKTELLQYTADELNFALSLFSHEVRKPNGEEYAPDSIYYLLLGIQQYLYENGRIDNIFTDMYYEKLTEALDSILQKYEVRLNPQGLIVCRIEEEHLWESKQLGAHSPHVLLTTLIYFNTRFFMLRSADEHLRLSFSHIMKHWKKTNVTGTKTPGRSVYLRYYSPAQTTTDANQKRKREDLPVYEQAENVDNPLRCPVKLYEFYLSKCPESIKNRNDVFYLVPERSCVPDSPVWYSTENLGLDAMNVMLHRIQVVREIQESYLQQTF